MTRKDFQLIADVIKGLADEDGHGVKLDDVQRNEVAFRFAAALKATNSQFKRERFLDACDAEY